MLESSNPYEQSPCRVCGEMCESAIVTGDRQEVICFSCHTRPRIPDERSRRLLKGLQKLAKLERELDKQGVLVGSVGLTIEDGEDNNS